MRVGASTFIWVSPFSATTLDLIGKVKDLGFDLIEICVEDPDTIDPSAIRRAAETAQLGITVCGAFGPNRDMSRTTRGFETTRSATPADASISRRNLAAQ